MEYIKTIYKLILIQIRRSGLIKYVILGFLTYGKLTGYSIKKLMEKTTSNFVNASFGSIYPELSKLEKRGLISAVQSKEKGKAKKVYEINDSGKREFTGWLEEPINFMKSYEDILSKVFFFGKLPEEKAAALIVQLVGNIDKRIEELQKVELEIKHHADFFEASTLYFGLEHLRFMRDWHTKMLKDLSNRDGREFSESDHSKRLFKEQCKSE
jgi:DNA-binding PadR family transcriptional regulator